MLRNLRNSMIIFCALAITFLSLGIITLFPAHAESAVTVKDAIAEFAMEDGAAIRKSTDKQGIRFNAILSENAYETLVEANAEFGMLIVPKDYVVEGYDLTVENVFGENAVYVPNVKASTLEQTDPTKKAIMQITNPTINLVNGAYKIYGSIVSVLDSNISRGFIGRAYVKVNDEYYLADYADGLVGNNTRSMAYVAKRAIDNSDADSATLQTSYVDKVKNETYEYTVNEITVEIDGSVTKEVVEEGSALFGTSIEHIAQSRFGFESYGVDSFVGMENAEFNVVYKAVPVNVVVDADATATELYAANELAGYVEDVTGKAVTVGVETRTINNIYISTDSSLGLTMDSFRLYTDANGNVHINGVDERGTLYGVYEYEEANLGIKFLSETYTYVPVTNKQIPTLDDAQVKNYVPAFNYRTYMNNGIGLDGNDNVKYSSHLRFIAQFSQEKSPTELKYQVQYFMPWMAKPWLSASHSLIYYAAIGAYVSGRTDLVDYALDGEGKFTSIKFNDTAFNTEADGALDNGQNILDVCYSSSTAQDWVTKGLKYVIDTYGSEYDYFMLGQADKTTECDCDACKKAIDKVLANFWSPKQNKADLTATFIKNVVTTVNGYGVSACGEKYSDNNIVMFAYQKTESAPKNTISGMPDNVYIQWAPIDQDRYFALDSANPEGWTEKTGINKFMVWSYETDFGYYFNYYPTMHTWIDNFQTYKDLGVEGVMMQSTWNTSGVADSYLDAYVASKLLWNFESDSESAMQNIIDSAKDEFIQYFYGEPAKDLILQYYANFDALYESKFSSGGYLNSGTRSFKESELRPLLDLIEQAKARTTDKDHLAHLTMLSLTPRYMLCQYCAAEDSTLLEDMNEAGVTRSREGWLIEDDDILKGFIKFKKGSTDVIAIENDANGRIVHITLAIPDNQEWTGTTASFTADYMNNLYADGVRSVQMYSLSTANTGNVIYTYDNVQNYNCQTIENATLSADGGEFRFCYVDVNGSVHGSGQTIGTTLDLYFNYYAEGEGAQDEIGLTLSDGVQLLKNPVDNSYVISNTNGIDYSAYFSAEKVNSWISQGYITLSLTVKFEAGETIDQVVGCYGNDTFSAKTNNSGYSEWTFALNQDTPVKLWAQKGGVGNSGAFTISDIELSSALLPYQTNYAKLISDSYDGNGFLSQLVVEIPNGTNWWINNPIITSTYLDGLYAQGVRQVLIDATSTATTNNFYTLYGSAETNTLSAKVKLVENSHDLKFSYVNLNAGGVTVGTTLTLNFTYIYANPEDIAEELGITLANGSNIAKDGNGGYVLSNVGLENNAGGMMSAYFSADKVNSWINQGCVTLTLTVSFTASDTIGQVVGLNGATLGEGNFTQLLTLDEEGSAVWTFNLVENSPIQFWAQKDYIVNSGAFTFSNIKLTIDPTVVASKIGATLNGDTTIAKNGDGSYTVSNAMGNSEGLEFSASQVNEWLSQGYTHLSMTISFTPVNGVINKTIVWSASEGYLIDTSGNAKMTIALVKNEKICVWTQYDNSLYKASFNLANVELSKITTTDGYSSITDVQYDEKGRISQLSASFENLSTGWDTNTPTLTENYLNFLYGLGVRTFEIKVTGNSHNLLIRYNSVIDFDGDYTVTLVENGGALEFSHLDVSAGNGLPTASTITLTFEYCADASEFGATAKGDTKVYKNDDGSYDIYDTRGLENCLEFTATQINAWLDAGYSSISFRLTFTAVDGVIDETVVYGQSSTMSYIGYIEDYSGASDLTLILNRDTAIYVWTQFNHNPCHYSTFTLSNFRLNYSFTSGYATFIDEQYDENGRLTSLTLSFPDGAIWWGDTTTQLNQTYLNDLLASGVSTIYITAIPQSTNNNLVVNYNGSETYTNETSRTIAQNGGDLHFAYVNLSTGATVGDTVTFTFTYA